MGFAHQNCTIAIASNFRVDGAKSPEIPQKEGVFLDLPFLAFSVKKETTEKGGRTPKILGKEGKKLKKARNSLQEKNQGSQKKQNKEDQGWARKSQLEIANR